MILAECLDPWKDGEGTEGNIYEYAYIAIISLKAFFLWFKQVYYWETELNMSIYNCIHLFYICRPVMLDYQSLLNLYLSCGLLIVGIRGHPIFYNTQKFTFPPNPTPHQ